MDQNLILNFSSRLKAIAKDLSFLAHPRFPLEDLRKIFPQHKNFTEQLQDISVPFPANTSDKKYLIEAFCKDVVLSDLSKDLKEIFIKRVQDYELLIHMMENFGTTLFYEDCIKLYGSSHHRPRDDFFQFLNTIKSFCHSDVGEIKFSGEDALSYLKQRMLETFPADEFEVKASSSLLSDSSAGRRNFKLNTSKSYSKSQLNIFLVHEGWVHLGTSINGSKHENHLWLGTWAPRTTTVQEGLAILVELITHNMSHERWNKVVLRHLVTTMAEKGSSIKEIYEFLLHQGQPEMDAFKLSLRVFRGVPLEGGMSFTKELLYLNGLIELLKHLGTHQNDLRSLWIGKISFDEHRHILNRQDNLSSQVMFFPKELEDSSVQKRLKEIQTLCFTHGF